MASDGCAKGFGVASRVLTGTHGTLSACPAQVRDQVTELILGGGNLGMRRVNPAFIARNHRVEEALSAAVERADYAPFTTLLNILSRPFDDQSEFAAFAEPAPEGQGCYRTFCGS